MDIEIKRDYYLEQLVQRQNNGLIKVITGIRRCGKSYLLRTLFKKYLLENESRCQIFFAVVYVNQSDKYHICMRYTLTHRLLVVRR